MASSVTGPMILLKKAFNDIRAKITGLQLLDEWPRLALTR